MTVIIIDASRYITLFIFFLCKIVTPYVTHCTTKHNKHFLNRILCFIISVHRHELNVKKKKKIPKYLLKFCSRGNSNRIISCQRSGHA